MTQDNFEIGEVVVLNKGTASESQVVVCYQTPKKKFTIIKAKEHPR
jgi:hypothetical protein